MLARVLVEDSARVAARIEAAAREGGGVVATDGDGTLWAGDVGEDLFFSFCDRGRIEPAAERGLRAIAAHHGVDATGAIVDVTRRIYDRYLEGGFPEETVCEVMTWCFAGWNAAEVEAFAREVVEVEKVAARLHGEVLEVFERVRAAGIPIYVVSASPRPIIEQAARVAGIAPSSVIAAEPRYEADVMLADVHRPIPYAAGKVTRLRERIGDRRLLAAFGDNAFDVAMLAAAHVPVAVRPKARLRARAAEIPHLVELEADPKTPAVPVRHKGR